MKPDSRPGARRLPKAVQTVLARMVEKYGADLVRASIASAQVNKRGRPTKKVRSMDREILADAIDELIEAHAQKGNPAAVRSAIAEAAEHESSEKGKPVPVETVRRYYRQGVKLLRARDMDIAAMVREREIARKGEGSEGARPTALVEIAAMLGLTSGLVDRRVMRVTKKRKTNV
jgi:hypothetical protein